MIHLGISEGFHDAAVAVVEDKQILFATNIERVTGKKNDKNIPDKYIKELKDTYDYDKTVFYEHFDTRMSDERLSDWQKQRRADHMISETFFIMKLTTPLLIILLLSYLTAQ